MTHAKKHTTHAATAAHETTSTLPNHNALVLAEKNLTSLLPALKAVSIEDQAPRMLPAFELVTAMRGWVAAAETQREMLIETFKNPPIAELNALPMLLDVTEHLALGIRPSNAQKNLKKLTDEQLVPARKSLRSVVEPLVTFGKMSRDVLDQTHDGRSAINVAEDVLKLITALRIAWPQIQGSTPLDMATLDRTEALAREALKTPEPTIAMTTDTTANPDATLDRADLLERATELLLSHYSKVRFAIQYLRAAMGDADDLTPSPYVIRGSGRGRKTPVKTVETTPATSAVTAAPATKPPEAAALPAA